MDVETIRDWLRNFVEDPEYRKQMSANVHESLWQMIQDIDIELEKVK